MDMLTSYLSVTFDKFRSITENDVLLQTVKKFIQSRWPDFRLLRQHADSSELEGVLPTLRVPHDRARMCSV